MVGGLKTINGKNRTFGLACKRKKKSFFASKLFVFDVIRQIGLRDQKYCRPKNGGRRPEILLSLSSSSSVAVVSEFFDWIFQARDRYRYGLEDEEDGHETKADNPPDTATAGRYNTAIIRARPYTQSPFIRKRRANTNNNVYI